MAFDPVAYINEPRWRHSKLGLERMRALLGVLGNPQDSLRFVHVAGTNGKGSVCAYLASILQAAGFRTGLFTSPYIVEFAERIRVDGCNIDDAALLEATLAVRDAAEAVAARLGEHPTEFELMCAVALEHFKRSGCDIAVMEVGLGGRLDATNAIPAPAVAVIARIGLDHTELLGDTPAAIAREKAGIVKPGSAVVTWPQEDAGALQAIREAAAAAGDPLTIVDFSSLECGAIQAGADIPERHALLGREGIAARVPDFAAPGAAAAPAPNRAPDSGPALWRPFRFQGADYRTALLGTYQPFNAAVALAAADALVDCGFAIDGEAKRRGIAETRWPGRFQLLQAGPPPLVADGGHNPQGARALADSLRDAFPGRKAVFIMGVLADKDYPAMIDEVAPLAKAFLCLAPPNPRALPASELAAAIRSRAGDIPVEAAAAPEEALAKARRLATPEDVIAAFGSLYTLGAFLTS